MTQYIYDGFGNRTTTIADTATLKQTTSATYDSVGNVTSITDPRGAVTNSTFDAARQLLTTTTPATPAAPAGLVTANTYDANGQVLQVRQSSAGTVLRTTSATYTLSGKVATATDARGNVTQYAYDLLDRLASTTDPMGRKVQSTYTALSQPFRTFNTAIQFTPLLEQTWTPDGQRASLKDANGNTTNFAYDRFDRLATTTYPGGTTERLTYDANGNVTRRCTRANQPIDYGYDTLNRMSSKTLPGAAAACVTTPSGVVTSYTYDLAGRATGVSDNGATIPAIATPPSAIVYGTAYSYDATNRPTGVTFDPVPSPTLPSASSSVTFTHGYNAANQRNSQAVTDSTWINYPAGAASDTCYTSNTLNQYAQLKSTVSTTCDTVVANPAYDSNGNLTDDGSTYKFEYDAENRLTRSKTSGSLTIGTYTFDGRGRRTSKTISGTTTIFVTDADNREVLEYDGTTGAIQRCYAYGLGLNAVLGQMNVAVSTRYTPVPDLLGSIVGIMNASNGSLTSFAYRSYGSNSTPPNQFGYTGQRLDVELSGFYYYRARQYSSSWGRFVQADPSGYSDGSHLYAYVANDPLNLIDPYGLSAEGARQSGWLSNAGNWLANNPVAIGAGLVAVGVATCVLTACTTTLPAYALIGGGTVGGQVVVNATGAVALTSMGMGTHIMAMSQSGGSDGSSGGSSGSGTGGGQRTVSGPDARDTLPQGMTPGQFGDLAGFQRSLAASARASTEATPEVVNRLQAAGVTREAIATYQKMYVEVVAQNPGNLSAVHRAALLANILKVF